MRARNSTPALMPHLSAGKHRSPRGGACFMEFASYLAGERFSDHPACTDASLSALARAVNDLVDDTRRDELLTDIPRVIGLHDPEAGDLLVAASAAASALPVASMSRQEVLVVGLRQAMAALDAAGIDAPELRRRVEAAIAEVPGAVRWADAHPELVAMSERRRRTRADRESASLAMLRIAVLGVAQACVADVDERLLGMLRDAIDTLESRRAAAPARAPEVVAAT